MEYFGWYPGCRIYRDLKRPAEVVDTLKIGCG